MFILYQHVVVEKLHQRWTTNITRFPPRYILAILFTAHVVFTIQIITKYKLFLAKPRPRSLSFNAPS